MKLFLDTANIEEIEEASAMGLISGVTTNPLIASKEGNDMKAIITNILSIFDGLVFAEVLGNTAEDMVREGIEMSKWDRRMVIKIPAVWEGFKALQDLKENGVTTAVTLVYSPSQALLAATCGANYVAPFIARAFEAGINGLDVISTISGMYKAQGVETKILAASIRTAVDAVKAVEAGADILTLPFCVLTQLAANQQTVKTLNQFMSEWEKNSL